VGSQKLLLTTKESIVSSTIFLDRPVYTVCMKTSRNMKKWI